MTRGRFEAAVATVGSQLHYWFPEPWRGHVREYTKGDLRSLALSQCARVVFRPPAEVMGSARPGRALDADDCSRRRHAQAHLSANPPGHVDTREQGQHPAGTVSRSQPECPVAR